MVSNEFITLFLFIFLAKVVHFWRRAKRQCRFFIRFALSLDKIGFISGMCHGKTLSFVSHFARFALSLDKIGFISGMCCGKTLSFVSHFARFALPLHRKK